MDLVSLTFWKYNECKSSNGGGTRGGGEGGYGDFLREGGGGVGEVGCTYVAVVSGLRVYTIGGVTRSRRRRGGLVRGGVGEWYCSSSSEVLDDLWEEEIHAVSGSILMSVFFCILPRTKRVIVKVKLLGEQRVGKSVGKLWALRKVPPSGAADL